ncbi:MAG: hypothetical protein R3348_08675 [Xanthomonadales bacterium]|nr:hypothetical protein [Xanthomonadales bacterium]
MLELTVLTTFAAVLAFFTLWFIRTTKKIGKALYKAFLPSSKGNQASNTSSDDSLPELSTSLREIAMPWGWRDAPRTLPHWSVKPEAIQIPMVPVPWGWPGGAMSSAGHAGVSFGNGNKGLRDVGRRVEIPFMRNHGVTTVRLRALRTYFDSDNLEQMLRAQASGRKSGFQLPWGW